MLRLGEAQLAFEPFPIADVANEPLPSPVRQNPRAHLRWEIAAVLAAKSPLANIAVPPQEQFLGLQEPLEVLRRQQVEDGLADNLLAEGKALPMIRLC